VSVLVVAVAGLGLSIAGTAGLFSGSSSAGPGTNQAASYVNLPAVATRTDERRAVVPPAAAALPGAPTPVPLSVSVPRLRSSAAVVGEVSVQSGGPEKGLLTAPANYHQLGWYRHGSAGVLVIDGHVGFHQDPGPLAYIGELVPGDTVVVAFQGDARSYRVTGVARAVKGQLPATYFSQAYNDQVMLITCDYTSTFSGGHFADNVYVIASLR
jgi:sortase (surface protein transpeptidase)